MTPDEFRYALNHGLGRAILRLDGEPDKQIFQAVWLEMLLNPEAESPGNLAKRPYYAFEHGVYDRDLIERFDPSGKLGEEVAQKILAKKPVLWHMLGLVSLLGHEKEVNDIAESAYDDMTSIMHKSLIGEGDHSPDDVADGWIEIAGCYAELGAPKREVIRRTFTDLAEMVRLAPEKSPLLRRMFYEFTDNLRGENWELCWDILFEDNPLSSVLTVTEIAQSPLPAEEITAERVLGANPTDPDYGALCSGFQNVLDETFFAVLDAIIAKKAAGDAEGVKIEGLFCGVSGRDTGELLKRARRMLGDMTLRSDPFLYWLLWNLQYVRDPGVRTLGLELMRSDDKRLVNFGRHTVYGANFMPEDADTVEEWLENLPAASYTAGYDVIAALDAGAEGVREEWIRTVYENQIYRLQIVRTLQGRLPDDMCEESLFDANPYVRQAARGEESEPKRHGRRSTLWKEKPGAE